MPYGGQAFNGRHWPQWYSVSIFFVKSLEIAVEGVLFVASPCRRESGCRMFQSKRVLESSWEHRICRSLTREWQRMLIPSDHFLQKGQAARQARADKL